VYTRGRVVFLLGLSQRDARYLDEGFVSCLANCTVDGPGSPTTHQEWDPVFTIAEWNDVQRAGDRVDANQRDAEGQLVLELRGRGHTMREIAELVKGSAMGVHRSARGRLGLILEELGGEAEPPAPARSQVEACLRCATWPRARLRARYRNIRGRGKVEVRAERQAAVCEHCLPEHLRGELVTTRLWPAA
jgi:hypothetical protein